MRIVATPVSGSPARIAAWTGDAPRQRGSSEACTLTQPRRGRPQDLRQEGSGRTRRPRWRPDAPRASLSRSAPLPRTVSGFSVGIPRAAPAPPPATAAARRGARPAGPAASRRAARGSRRRAGPRATARRNRACRRRRRGSRGVMRRASRVASRAPGSDQGLSGRVLRVEDRRGLGRRSRLRVPQPPEPAHRAQHRRLRRSHERHGIDRVRRSPRRAARSSRSRRGRSQRKSTNA